VLLPQSVTSPTDPSLALRAYGTDPVGRATAPGIAQGNLRIASVTLTQDIYIVANVLPVVSSFFINKTGLLFLARTGRKPGDREMTITLPTTSGYQAIVVPIFPSGSFLSVTKGVGAGSKKLTFPLAPQAATGN